VEVTAVRPITALDKDYSILLDTPDGWRRVIHDVPSNTMAPRLVTMRVGKQTEAYISKSSLRGGILSNVNRWCKQMGAEPVESLSSLPTVKFLGVDASFVVLEGTFQKKENWAMRVVVTASSEDMYSFKMVGPKEEVAANEEKFKELCASVRNREEEANEAP